MENKEILKQAKNIAVIGVTQNKDKYGYKIYQRLKQLKKQVFGVSPIYKEIEKERTYSSLLEIPCDIDMAVFVVNSTIAIAYVEECKAKHIPICWFQPNTYDENLVKKVENSQLQPIFACVLVESESLLQEIHAKDKK